MKQMLTQTCNPGFKQSMCCRALFSYINPMNFSFCTSPVKIYMSILPHSCLYPSENVAVSHKGPLTSGITTSKNYSPTEQAQQQNKLTVVKFLCGRCWRKRGGWWRTQAGPMLNHQCGVCGKNWEVMLFLNATLPVFKLPLPCKLWP